jgi:3'-5' exonuclease
MGAINNVCFIDIETVPQSQYMPLDNNKLFKHKFKKAYEAGGNWEEIWTEKASLHAEFGKVVSVSIGRMMSTKFYIRTITSRHENEILTKFAESLEKPTVEKCNLVAHNGMEFDYPFLMRRYIINSMPVPALLNVHGVKPWDYRLEDTMKMWSGTQWAYKASLELICEVLGITNPKSDISGANISDIYYGMMDISNNELPFDKEAAALKAIGDYNGKDVLTLAQVYCRMKGLPCIEESQVEYVL